MKKLDLFMRGMFFLSLLFLSFMLGIVASIKHSVFYTKTQEIFEYAEALGKSYASRREHYDWTLWTPEPEHKSGLVMSDPRRYDHGLTLYTANESQAFLVDMAGHVVHRWHLPYSEAFGEDGPEEHIYWGGAHAFPNGDLLVQCAWGRQVLYGKGLLKLDRDSHVLWLYKDHVHHMLSLDPAGNIYTLTAALRTDNPYGIARIDPPFLDEQVAVLDKDGHLVKKIPLIRAFLHSPYADLLNRSHGREITHANQVSYIGPDIAAKFPFAKEGDLLISLRDMDTIALLDPRSESITWAKTGFWKGQHDPSFLENGHMLVFDNHCYDEKCFPPGLRVVEFDPLSLQRFWEFDAPHRMSMIKGQAQRLPNGNTLITESQAGRLLEVTPQNEVVWDYYNPVRAEDDKHQYISFIHYAHRFPDSYFTFLHD